MNYERKIKNGTILGLSRVEVNLKEYDKFNFFGNCIYRPNSFDLEDTYISVYFIGNGKIDNKNYSISVSFIHVSETEKEAQSDLNNIEKYINEFIETDNMVSEFLALQRMEMKGNNKLFQVKGISDLKISVRKLNDFTIIGTINYIDLIDNNFNQTEFITSGTIDDYTLTLHGIGLDENINKDSLKYLNEFEKYITDYLQNNSSVIETIREKNEYHKEIF